YRGVERYEEMVLPLLKGKTISEILPFTFVTEESSLVGERQSRYTSDILLLIDGFCASACETIVEKLSWHP
ncbi:hypothetical protein P0Q09_08445, partial [Campylobacter jejuni]|uniref:hypothetical protein n=1 Tax=Campylobacter jejuni TaxID=197 RepID=UPI002F96A59D